MNTSAKLTQYQQIIPTANQGNRAPRPGEIYPKDTEMAIHETINMIYHINN